MSKLFHSKDSDDSKPLFESWSFSKTNYVLFGIGLALVIFGYLVMYQGPEGVDSFESGGGGFGRFWKVLGGF